jgi:hypothetical protein
MAKKSQPWWKTEGVWDGPGTHEPISFMRRRGGCHEDIEAIYERNFSNEAARKIAEAGHNYVESCFFKGLGIEAEAHELARTKRYVKALQENGVRAGVYTQWGSLFTETFFLEFPEAREWVQVDPDGKPIEYGDRIHQYFRWRGCPGNRDFIQFLKDVCRLAIEEFGVDVVYFDNMCIFEGHDTVCYCDCCKAGFSEYLKKKFPTPESSWERFGLWTVEGITPPPFKPWSDYTETPRPIIDPVMQEFIEFRCQQFAEVWHEVYEYIHNVKPSVGLMGNPSFPRKYNERLTSAIDFWQLRKTEAFYYMENAVAPQGVREGAISSNAPGYKYGRALDLTFVPCGSSPVPGLDLAECMAFNNGSGHLGNGYEDLFAFLKDHKDEFYRDVEPAADVAVLRDDISLTWRWHETYTVMSQAHQQLLCSGIPWMPIWGQQLLDGTLDRYHTLIVPGCACMSRDQVAAIFEFVEEGGTAIILENAGTYSEVHRQIATWRFAPLFESVADAGGFEVSYIGRNGPGTFANRKKMIAEVGKGRAIYLPQIRAERDAMPSYAAMGEYNGLQHLALPPKWKALPDTVAKCGVGVRVEGPKTVFCEVLRKTKSGALLVHLVNYDKKSVPPALSKAEGAGVKVVVSDADGKSATLYLPDKTCDAKAIKLTRPQGKRTGPATIKLPAFKRYALIVLK